MRSLSRVFAVTFRAYKEVMLGQLTHIIEGGGLDIPAEYEELIVELKGYKKGGRPHMDDRVDLSGKPHPCGEPSCKHDCEACKDIAANPKSNKAQKTVK